MVSRLALRHVSPGRPAAGAEREWRILDAGCGTGGSLTLRRTGHSHAELRPQRSRDFLLPQTARHDQRAAGLDYRYALSHNQRSTWTIPCDVLCDAGAASERPRSVSLPARRPGGRLFSTCPPTASSVPSPTRPRTWTGATPCAACAPAWTGRASRSSAFRMERQTFIPVVLAVRLSRSAAEHGASTRRAPISTSSRAHARLRERSLPLRAG